MYVHARKVMIRLVLTIQFQCKKVYSCIRGSFHHMMEGCFIRYASVYKSIMEGLNDFSDLRLQGTYFASYILAIASRRSPALVGSDIYRF